MTNVSENCFYLCKLVKFKSGNRYALQHYFLYVNNEPGANNYYWFSTDELRYIIKFKAPENGEEAHLKRVIHDILRYADTCNYTVNPSSWLLAIRLNEFGVSRSTNRRIRSVRTGNRTIRFRISQSISRVVRLGLKSINELLRMVLPRASPRHDAEHAYTPSAAL